MSYPDNPEPRKPRITIPQYPLFVYGTLRPRQENYTLLRGYTLSEQPAHVTDHTMVILDSRPVVVPGNHIISGDLLEINPHVYEHLFAQLDKFENATAQHPTGSKLLQRQLCRAYTPTESVVAWIYRADTLPIRPEAVIAHGDWVKYQNQRFARTRFRRYIDDRIQKGVF